MGEAHKIMIDEVMDLANIQTLYDACNAALQTQEQTIILDASKVERIKTPVYQLILVFKKTLESQNRTLTIEGGTEAFYAMAECLGIKAHLGAQ